jgi:hypothetical protein
VNAFDIWPWLLAFAPAIGHVLYGIPTGSGDGRMRVSLHNGDDFAPTDEPPRPDRLRNVRAIGQAGSVELTASGDRETGVFIDAPHDAAMVVAESVPNFIELSPEKFDAYLRHEGLFTIIDVRAAATGSKPGREIYSKHIKVALTPREHGSLVLVPVGLPIEFVADLASALRSRTLDATVLVNGAAAAGQQARVTHRARDGQVSRDVWEGATDADGKVSVELDGVGLWRIHSIAMVPHDAGDADWRSYWACLTFEL